MRSRSFGIVRTVQDKEFVCSEPSNCAGDGEGLYEDGVAPDVSWRRSLPPPAHETAKSISGR